MENTKKEFKKTVENVRCEGCIIENVSSPDTIMRVAKDKGINPQEVFVRVTFGYKEHSYTVSNKLRFITKAGYEELVDAKNSKKKLILSVDTENGFFYVEHDVKVEDLFKDEVVKQDTRTELSALL